MNLEHGPELSIAFQNAKIRLVPLIPAGAPCIWPEEQNQHNPRQCQHLKAPEDVDVSESQGLPGNQPMEYLIGTKIGRRRG